MNLPAAVAAAIAAVLAAESPPAPVLPPSPPPLSLGTFEVLPGLPGVVVAAPHEGFDLRTSEVASGAATVMGAGFVVASGFRQRSQPINVNRPTEGVGIPAAQERATARADTVFRAYLARLGEASKGPVRLLIEVHGNSRPENSGVVEVASVGLDRDGAAALKSRLETQFRGLRVLVEPIDTLHYQGEGTKSSGTFAQVRSALQIELPAALRAPGTARETGRKIGAALIGWLGGGEATASVGVPAAR